MTLLPEILVTNEPARVNCGAPDYVLTKKDIPVGYIEAKDIGVDLNSKTLKEQFDRYRSGLSNLIFTDYLDFHFYKDGIFITSVAIAKIEHGNVIPLISNFTTFQGLIKNFALTVSQTIKSPTKLAEMMAGKAKLMADVIEKSLNYDDEAEKKSALKSQMLSFKQMLIHDITNSAFADIYSQTIAYGMFAARYHDPTLSTFSRQEASELIPKSNPFLRKLFHEVAGPDLDDRLVWIVDELVSIFLATDVAVIMKDFGKSTKQEDPVVHFYETFLANYNPALRKARGVWYTPQPVVSFIVRAVDDILKTEFSLPQGLADTSKIKIKLKTVTKATSDQRSKLKQVEVEHEVHKVQILDPATGTGTFLSEVVKHIYKKFEGQQGIWSNYVNQHLIPRLNGFELLMASYAMAHLKMDMLLTETGYKATTEQRFRIFLTNSLEEAHPDTGTLFSSWLSDEADQANAIKRDTPVMVVMGNPPYSGESDNKSKWIMNLMEDYKKEPGGKEKLRERNSKFINDDYVKFLRFGQHFIDKNGSGVLAFINPHGFLDNPTFRGMRWNLLKSFNSIYTIDLHGNSKKKEISPDGSPDVNVFDIMQGVSINILIKTGSKIKDDLATVKHFDLFGKRESKYSFLSNNSLKSIPFTEFKPTGNFYLFKKTDETLLRKYNSGINPLYLFRVNVMGFQTHRDDFAIDFDSKAIRKRALDLKRFDITNEEIFEKYNLKDNRDWNLVKARKDIQADSEWESKIINCGYRPFDNRPCYFSYVMMDYPRKELIQNVLNKENILLGIGRQGMAVGNIEWCLTTVTKYPTDANIFRRGGINLFPLYLYPEQINQPTLDGVKPNRVPNLNMDIVDKIAISSGYHFQSEEASIDEKVKNMQFCPIDILDYIYAVLHSPAYRKEYKEFLKTDFPRIPYPTIKTFFPLVNLGKKLREFHLMESEETEKYITQYPEDGNNEVVKSYYNDGKVFINETQYFDNVPEVAWNFYIGGYQPAQKWLKDRKGRVLEFDDILHYQKIIVALNRTNELMIEIDKVIGI
ncbi:type ISP restriction/modification enzyme [Pedobacter sp. JCM 36344]|uniref:type ISP restriction/modification enzyme n=1 Tax=Pedobacter sp. JCM 36344 TaxID=3374280 RepID=UPI00397B4BA9